MNNVKQALARFLPAFVIEALDRLVYGVRRARIRALRRVAAALGYNIVKHGDYYSVLPVLEDIEKTRARWDRPSGLVGLTIPVDGIRARLGELAERWEADYTKHAGPWSENVKGGFGPGYPEFDARTLYYQLRELRPKRYLEVGSGLSTYYAHLAGTANDADGAPLEITCIEPYPYDALHTIPGITLREQFVQDVPVEVFEELEDGDVLFIDSSHAFKIDSDVAYLLLEVLPRVKPGVVVHIHDVHFPYNGPYPADFWLFGERWPVYWNEAMAVQTFLAFNDTFEVQLSTPMLRHADEDFLVRTFPDYTPVSKDPNPPSSLWLRRVR